MKKEYKHKSMSLFGEVTFKSHGDNTNFLKQHVSVGG